MFHQTNHLRVIIILFLFLISVSCGDDLSISDNINLKSNEGILHLNISYIEGYPTFSNLDFIIENIEKSSFIRFSLDNNTKKTITAKLRSGIYYFADVYAKPHVEYYNPQNEGGDKTIFQGEVMENVFRITPGQINYIGDVTIQIRRQQLGHIFKIFPQGARVGENLFFIATHFNASINHFKKNYPNLIKNYPIQRTKIFYGNKSIELKENYKKNEYTYGYGPESIGEDTQGYGEMKWGMPIDKVKSLLNKKKAKYSQINQYTIIENNSKLVDIHYRFSKLNDKLWKNKLFQVDLHFKLIVNKVVNIIQAKYGNPIVKQNKWIWEIPSTLLILVPKKDNQSKLSYISKLHLNIEKKRKIE